MYVCICNAITDRQIVQAAKGGARSSEDLTHRLGVGLGCGHCRACAKALLMEALAGIASDATREPLPALQGSAS